MSDVLMLCGSMFNLNLRPTRNVYLRRHRLFESSMFLWPPAPCADMAAPLPCTGTRAGSPTGRRRAAFGSKAEWEAAMQIHWINADMIAEAIPPAYTEWIGAQLLRAIEAAA